MTASRSLAHKKIFWLDVASSFQVKNIYFVKLSLNEHDEKSRTTIILDNFVSQP